MRVAIVAGLVFLAVPIGAQTADPLRLLKLPASPPAKHLTVAASVSAMSAKPGGNVSLFVDIAPRQGIHVYAPGATDYVPIVVKLDAHADVKAAKLTYPKSEILFFAPLGERVPVYQKPFRLTQGVTIAGSVKPGTTITLTGTVDYQACDDKVCFVPASVPVSWTVDVK